MKNHAFALGMGSGTLPGHTSGRQGPLLERSWVPFGALGDPLVAPAGPAAPLLAFAKDITRAFLHITRGFVSITRVFSELSILPHETMKSAITE